MPDDFPVAVCENITLGYEGHEPLLKDVNFKLSPGSFHFLTGPSGSGKTTLLKMLYGVLSPVKGRVLVLGHDVPHMTHQDRQLLRQKIGVVFQDDRSFNHLTVFENVELPLKMVGRKKQDIEINVVKLLKWIGLERHIDAFPDELSGGERQRLAIARAIIARPKLLLADEPTGNVDDAMALKLLHLFSELNKNGTTCLVATHNQALVRYFKYPRLHTNEDHSLQILPPYCDQGESHVA